MARNVKVEREYMSRLETANFLGLSEASFDRLRKEGELPEPYLLGKNSKLMRWKRSEIIEYLKKANPQPVEGNTEHDPDDEDERSDDHPLFE